MKITLAQLNPTIGDLNGNLAKLIRLVEAEAGRSDLIIAPELYLIGYPPRDLLEKPILATKIKEVVEQLLLLSRRFPQLGLVVGAPWPTGKSTGKGLYNAALLIYQGELRLQAKSLLPSYDVFDETRYFDRPDRLEVWPFKGEVLGVSVCEDAWTEHEETRRLYDYNPIEDLVHQGATLLINISASPFHYGKDELRYQIFQQHCWKYQLPFIYLNQVGGNDELIFDGHSFVLTPAGLVHAELPPFQEAVVQVDTAQFATGRPFTPLDKIASIHDALILGVRDYLRKCGFQRAVVGLSGGVDSSVTCYLACQALGPENVLGVIMPSLYSSPSSVTDSQQLARNLGIQTRVVPITPIYEAYRQALKPCFPVEEIDVTLENIQARIRGNILMAFSNKLGYLVLSTGNKSELAVGYCTLYGDMSGGLAVISDVPKTMIYQLAHYINREREIIPRAIIEKVPSAELRPNQRDQDTLPPYDILDAILEHYINDKLSPADIIARGFEAEVVQWVTRTVDRNEYKRRQAAPGLRVTTKAFGSGRRMPIAARYDF